ncbi:TPA: hypothetical protein U0398_000030 [Streptococcus suis]|nr:hypothetical protein [Streptococcus suis]
MEFIEKDDKRFADIHRQYNNIIFYLINDMKREQLKVLFSKFSKDYLDKYDILSDIIFNLNEEDYKKIVDFFGITDAKDYPYQKFISEIPRENFDAKNIAPFERHIKLCCHQREFMTKNSKDAQELANNAKDVANEANKVKGKIYSEFISILGIFTAISFAMMGSIQILGNIFNTVDPNDKSIGYAMMAGGIYILVLSTVITFLLYGMSLLMEQKQFKLSGWCIFFILFISTLLFGIGYFIWK